VIIGALVTIILDTAVLGYDFGSVSSPLNSIFDLVTFLPSLSLASRRLHDIDWTAWWLLIALTGIGTIVLIVWFCFKGTPSANRCGPDALQSH
jgi:uncharacterized membrane protein YhaH (DUF805 family)